jgi:hypothetical protein
MKRIGQKELNREVQTAVQSDLTKYCAAHPDSPAAERHPRILIDHGRYVALLGRSIRRDVFGFGSSVASALRAFDNLYMRSRPLRPH